MIDDLKLEEELTLTLNKVYARACNDLLYWRPAFISNAETTVYFYELQGVQLRSDVPFLADSF